MVILWGWVFLMSEVTLYLKHGVEELLVLQEVRVLPKSSSVSVYSVPSPAPSQYWGTTTLQICATVLRTTRI